MTRSPIYLYDLFIPLSHSIVIHSDNGYIHLYTVVLFAHCGVVVGVVVHIHFRVVIIVITSLHPLVDRRLTGGGGSALVFGEILGHVNGANRVGLVHDKQTLHLGCGNQLVVGLESLDELVAQLLLAGEEPHEHLLGLVLGGIVNTLLEVNSSRSNESRIQTLGMVGGHEDDSFFRRSHTVQGVQKTREGDSGMVALIGTLLSLIEGRIYIFQKKERSLRHMVHQVIKTVVGKSGLGKIENTNVVIQFSS